MSQRDINVPSKWAEAAWAEVTANGYFDGTRPGATYYSRGSCNCDKQAKEKYPEADRRD